MSRLGRLDRRRPIVWDHPHNRNLVAWWAGVPGWSGGTALRDLVRGGHAPHDGTLVNGPTWVGGPPGSPFAAVKLDGTDDYISTASGLPSYSSGFASATWNLWVKLVAAGSYPHGITQANNVIMWLGDDADHTPKMFGNGGQSLKSTLALTVGRWSMLTCVWGPFGSASLSIYIDGQPAGTNTLDYAITNVTSPQFGRRDTGFYANAVFGPIQYWFGPQKAGMLSAGDVASLYEEAVQGYPETLSWVRPWSFGISAAGGQTATPGVATVAITGVSPTDAASGQVTVTPGVAAVAVTGVSPSDAASGQVTVTPGVAVVPVTGISPSSSAFGQVGVTPGVATVAVSATTITVSPSGQVSVTPGVAVVVITGVSPTASPSGSATGTPSFATVTITAVGPSGGGGGTLQAVAGVSSIAVTALDVADAATGSVQATPSVTTVSVSGVPVSASPGGSTPTSVSAAIISVQAVTPDPGGTGTAQTTVGIAVVQIHGVDVGLIFTGGPVYATAGLEMVLAATAGLEMVTNASGGVG